MSENPKDNHLALKIVLVIYILAILFDIILHPYMWL